MQANQKDDGGFSVSGPDRSGDEGRQDLGKYGLVSLANILAESPFNIAFAFDPGDSTGVCALGRSFKCQTEDQAGLFGALSCTEFGIPGIVFYEGFVSRPARFSRTQIAPQNIGAIKLWAHLNNFKAVEVQPAQTHKIKREDVRAAGWTWKTEHEFDAIRILIYGMITLRYR
jgi:hypothetical protein